MATTPMVFTAQGIRGGDWIVLGRLLREDPASHDMLPCAQDDVVSVTRYLVDLDNGSSLLYTDTLSVNDTILPALSTGSVWGLDNVGFNVHDQIPGAKLNDTLGVEAQYSVALVDGTVVKWAVQIDLKNSN